jgi:hypothetical protein
MMTTRFFPRACALAVFAALLSTSANAYSDRVQNNCKSDYLSYCSAHPVGSTGMRRCMEANGKSLSPRCLSALADAGEIPRSKVKK